MGRSFQTEAEECQSELNLTPLIDVLLVLLVLLMLTLPARVSEQTLPVVLPEAVTGEPTKEQITLRLTVQGSQQWFLGKRLVSPEQLALVLVDAFKKDPEVDALVRAQGEVSHQDVVALVDFLRHHQVRRIGLAVQARLEKDVPRQHSSSP